MGKRIACICGKPGRVQHTRMKFLRDNYLPYLDVYADDVPDLKKYDVVYFSHYSLAKKVKFDRKRKYLASVTSHKYDKKDLRKFDKISVNNRLLLEELKDLKPALTENGVDTNFWAYKPLERGWNLSIGWVGNRDRAAKQWDVWCGIRDEMRRYGVTCHQVVTTKHGSQEFTPQQMLDFYHGIHVLVNTSSSEGTPNPALEAMSCGCYVLAPQIGNLADMPHTVASKTDDMLWWLGYLADGERPGYSRYMMRKHMEREWDWSIKYKAWDNFFKEWL